MAEEVSAALNQADPSLVLSAAFKLRITQRDLATLREGNWLNDEVHSLVRPNGGTSQRSLVVACMFLCSPEQ
jgi:hypothetical protein